ncbi:MAG: LacI family DNA-binding transcriptional regulator [Streptosporangiales bacterium]
MSTPSGPQAGGRRTEAPAAASRRPAARPPAPSSSLAGGADQSPVTLEDVARVAGVHYSTVSRALDPAKAWRVGASTRRHVETVALEMGYRRHMGASGLKRGRTHTVGVIVADLGNPFISPVLRGLANRLDEASLMPLITETQDDPARLSRVLNHVLERRVDAVVVGAARLGNAPILMEVASRRVPLLLFDRNVPQTGLPSCTHDHRQGGSLAAAHLLELGHRRVAQLRGPADVSSFVDRGRGFSAAVAAAGAGATEIDVPDVASKPVLDEGRRLARVLLSQPGGLPTAIFAHNDLMALGVLDALAEAGLRCPGDVSVMGYNDSPHVDRVTPPLTTIRLHGQELGRLVGEMAVTAIQAPGQIPVSLTLPPSIIIRESTAFPREGEDPR